MKKKFSDLTPEQQQVVVDRLDSIIEYNVSKEALLNRFEIEQSANFLESFVDQLITPSSVK